MRPRWLYTPRVDVALGWAWLPLFALAHLLVGQRSAGADRAAGSLLAAVLLLSLLHQPLTLLLVYGDRGRFDDRTTFFTWAPLAVAVAVTTAVLLDLWLLLPVAALWQTYHTQQQRYGLLRVYARKAGYGSVAADRALTYLPLAVAVASVVALGTAARQLSAFGAGLGTHNIAELRALLGTRPPLLLVVTLCAAAGVTVVAYVAQERRAWHRGVANPAKWSYAAAGVAAAAGLVLDPFAGLIGLLVAHAVEYLVVADRALHSRYGSGRGQRSGSFLAVAASTTPRRVLLLVGFLGAAGLLDVQVRDAVPGHAYLIALYTVGAALPLRRPDLEDPAHRGDGRLRSRGEPAVTRASVAVRAAVADIVLRQ